MIPGLMSPRSALISLALVAGVCVQMGGCLTTRANDRRDTDQPAQPPSAQPDKPTQPTMPKDPGAKRDAAKDVASFTGTLRSGIAGIGGEHTGWQVERTGGLPPIEVAIDKVKAAAAALDGKQVVVTGRMIDKKYTERGVVKVLQAQSIVEAKSQRY